MLLSELQIPKGFDDKKTGMPNYDDMLGNPSYFEREKGKTFEIVQMSPKEYVRKVAHEFGRTAQQILKSRDMDLAKEYTEKMKKGELFPMLTIDTSTDSFNQEGIHRAMAAHMAGLPKVPVMVVTKFPK